MADQWSRRPVGEVFRAFLLLGLTSFGGPIAHLGYFRTEFVARRRWLSENDYADLVALCQFLPGPASSQVGFALGLLRGGPAGALAAWLAFTLPSALLMVLFALGVVLLEGPVGEGLIHGLKLVAVAVVAHAVWGMAQSLCPDRERAGIALAGVVAIVAIGGPLSPLVAIVLGALAGLALCRQDDESTAEIQTLPVSRFAGHAALGLFLALLAGLPLTAWLFPQLSMQMLDAFYRSGALVFGGGHVVLPLLEAEVVQSGWVSRDEFLSGYGAAQALPGPLFTFAAYLGAVIASGAGAFAGAGLALIMIFLPGLLLLVAVLPHWSRFRRYAAAQAVMRGANAAVVGILGAALYDPVWTSAVTGPAEFTLALTGFLLLAAWQLPSWAVVLILAVGGVMIGL